MTERLESVNTIRAHQRIWLADTREHAEWGFPFVICTSNEFEEMIHALGIPVLVINYWSFLIAAQRKVRHFSGVLEKRGYAGDRTLARGFRKPCARKRFRLVASCEAGRAIRQTHARDIGRCEVKFSGPESTSTSRCTFSG